MKTKTIIVFYLILFLLGMALVGRSQGIVNDAGYITASSSNYLKFSGSNDTYLINSAADQLTLGNLTIDFTGSGISKLTITDSSFVTVNGTLTLNDSLLLEADTGMMASLITNGSISGSKAIVEQDINADQWHMVSSPVSSALADVYTGVYLMKWNEPDSTWAFITSLTDPLTVCRGYFAWSESTINSPEEVSFTGLLNTGNQTVSGLSYNTGSNKGQGWNLVGNPYPSPLEWNSSWTKSGIDATVYIYDGTQYLTWNYNLGGIGSMGNGNIPASQGFWVKANSASPSMTIPNSERVHKTQQFYKSTDATDVIILNVELAGNNDTDELILGMSNEASDAFDSEFDAWKLFGAPEAPQLFSVCPEGLLSVNIFPEVNSSSSLDLGYRCGAEGIYELHFKNLDNLTNGVKAYLEDKSGMNSQDKLYDLQQEPVYKFETQAGTYKNRFVLHFYKYNDSGDQLSSIQKTGVISIYANKQEVYVNNSSAFDGEAVVYDLLGQQIARQKLQSQKLNHFSLSVHKGFYIVNVLTGENVESRKIYIN